MGSADGLGVIVIMFFVVASILFRCFCDLCRENDNNESHADQQLGNRNVQLLLVENTPSHGIIVNCNCVHTVSNNKIFIK